MILTDYFRSSHDMTWNYAKQCGVEHGVIRLPEDSEFDITDFSHWEKAYKGFVDFGYVCCPKWQQEMGNKKPFREI